MTYYNINGEMTPASEASLGVMDLAILRGYGIFDYFLFKKGRPLFFDDYINRFEHSVAETGLTLPISRAELMQRIMKVIAANGSEHGAIRLILTGGYAPDSFTPSGQPNLLILKHDTPTYPADWFTDGHKLILHKFEREIPEAKTINYVTGIRAIPKIQAAGAFDVLYHDGTYLAEAARSNFFIVTEENTIVTAGSGILRGITRNNILRIAAQNKISVVERKVGVAELKTAKEAFISSTTKGALPIVQIDDFKIGHGKVGVVTQKMRQLLAEHTQKYLQTPLEIAIF
ncbi:MAG: aminotransferase class IV [Saprospiraceae bacterium]